MPAKQPVVFRLLCEYSIDANGWASLASSVRAWTSTAPEEARELYTNGLASNPDWPEPGSGAYAAGRLLPLARLFGDLAPSLAASAMVDSVAFSPSERIEAVLVRLGVEIIAGGPTRRERPLSIMFLAYQNVAPYWVLVHQARTADDYLPDRGPDQTPDAPERIDIRTKRFRSTIDSPGWQSLRVKLAAQYRPAIGALLAAVPHSKLG